LAGVTEDKRPIEDLGEGLKITIDRMLKMSASSAQSGVIWRRMGTGGGLCERGNEIHGISFMVEAPKLFKDSVPCIVMCGNLQKYRVLTGLVDIQ